MPGPSRATGFASLPLHSGRAPAWLFQRMIRLSREIVRHLAADYGTGEVLRRLSDPHWFQAFGCVLGFDWHSSGVTTTVCGALKEALVDAGPELGLFAAGGKGAASRKTPRQIADACERLGRDPAPLVLASRLAAKVDSAAVQDGYQIYHHAFFFTAGGDWCIVQQGLNDRTRYARRYHWLSERVSSFVEEPHAAVCCDARGATLNLVAGESGGLRASVVELARERPEVTLEAVRRLPAPALATAATAAADADTLTATATAPARATGRRASSSRQPALPFLDTPSPPAPSPLPHLVLPARHALLPALDVRPSHLERILLATYEQPPEDFTALVGREGVGAKTLRALALASELIHGTPLSTRDPARFAFAHGGKDGIPFPVDRETYDRTIAVLRRALDRATVDRSEKADAFRRLATFESTAHAPRPEPPQPR